MTMPTLVLIDTCIWVQFFNSRRSAEKAAVDALLKEDRATLIGPILSEILLGFRHDDQADWVASELRGVRWLEVGWLDWQHAANLGRSLAASGHKLPLSDLVVASVALTGDAEVYTTDPHFDVIPGLRRFVR